MPSAPSPRLTISQAASYAGVTVRAVRHYHQVGLLHEPPRDRSGYRRYSAGDVIHLIRIRALADAGVPLSRVGELLAADRDALAAAVVEIDEQLRVEIGRLEDHRAAVAKLATADGIALPPEVVAYLEQLRGLGLSERMIELERDGWLLIAAQLPDSVGQWIADKRSSFDVPEVVAAYRSLDRAFSCEPGDPYLEEVADQFAELFEQYYAAYDGSPPTAPAPEIDETMVAMLDAESVGSSPGWRHLEKLLERRGWVGWNDFGPPSRIGDGADAAG